MVEGATDWTYTLSTGEDGTSAVGWSIGDNSEYRNANETGNFLTDTGNPFLIHVTGTLGGIVLSSDATLSALVLEDASDNSAITISPVFASGTTSYTASVGNGVDEITIAPTVNESNATVEYLDSSDAAITDANSGKTGQQVSLSVDANTIKVKVTAEDTTTDTYTVVVTRAAAAPMVTDVDVTSAPDSGDTYGTSEMILFTVTFDQAVMVTGTPEFEFCLGTTSTASCNVGTSPPARRRAALSSGSGTTALVFGYTVVVGDVDDNGIWIGDQDRTIKLETGDTIQGTVSGLDAVLNHDELGEKTGHKVNGASSNNAPTVATEILDQTATTGAAFSYQVPAATFTDADSDTLTYTATLADDSALPAWLSFTAATRTFSGTPQAADVETVSVKVTASDGNGGSVSDTFDIVVDLPPDTSSTLVSNAGQGEDHNWTTRQDWSQTFTTSVGATLSSVEIISEDAEGDDAAVSLCTVDGSDHPTSTCTVLTAPPSFAAGTLVFRAPANTTLAANTTYSLLIASPGGEWLLLDATDSDNEDAGGATGWSIANTFDVEDSPDTWVARALALRITIKGTLNNSAPTVATEIPDQTAMSGTAFSYQFPAATFTDADSDTLTYEATLADDMALPSWLSFAPATRTFSGTPTAVETVSVKVTASDASDSVSDTFDIVVSAPLLTTCTAMPDLSLRRQIWTGELTVAAKTFGGVIVYYGFVADESPPVGALDPVTFGTGLNDYTVNGVLVGVSTITGDLEFSLTSGNLTTAEVDALLLHVCDTPYEFSAASASGAPAYGYTWTDDLDWSMVTTLTLYLSLPANNAATGAPEITGTAEVGEELVVDVTTVEDDDAIASGTVSYEWFHVDGATETSISGARGALLNRYTVSESDAGLQLKVKMSFTDALGNKEELESAPVSVAALPAITVEADRAKATGKVDFITYTLTREGATAAALTVTLTFEGPAGNDWGLDPAGSAMRQVTFGAGQATVTQIILLASGFRNIGFNQSTTEGGTLTARLGAVTGYDTSDTDEVVVVVVDGPAWVIQLSETAYRFTEDGGAQTIVVEATAGSAEMPPPSLIASNTSAVTFVLLTAAGTAVAEATMITGDYVHLNKTVHVLAPGCSVGADDALVCRTEVTLTLVDDDLAEPDETFDLVLSSLPGLGPAIRYQGPDGMPSSTANAYPVTIRDDDFAVTGVTLTSTPLLLASGSSTADTYGEGERIEFSVAFTRPVTVTGAPTFSFVLGTATKTATYTSGSDSETLLFAYTVTSSDMDTDGISWTANTLALAGGTIAGTGNLEHSAQTALTGHRVDGSRNADNIPPTLANEIPNQMAMVGTAFNYAFLANTFNDADGDALTYTATLADDSALPTWLTFSAATRAFSGTPQAADVGTVAVKVTASDGNGESVSDSFDIVVSVAMDTTGPRVASIVRRIPTSSPTNADSLTWRVTFSEAVSNVNAADFAVSGTTATVTAVAVSGVTGAYDVSASGGNLAALNATVTLAIAASHNIEDGASNSLTNTTPTGTNNNSYVVDNTAPSVTISGVPASSDAPFRATFTFSEAVTGFAVGDIRLDNASGSSFTVTSTTVYRALVTPTAAGTVTVDVSANAARDAAGNGNTAATQASSTYSGTVIPAAMLPTVTLRTQSVPESIGTAMLVVTLDQPASAPLSVPWYTLSSTAASRGDYTNGAGTLIIPSGVTNATISITIIDDAVEEPTETVLVLLSPGDGYDLGGSGATVSILDDDGDGPAPSGATVDGATVVLTYNKPLDGASTPSSTAFVLRVAGDPVSINEVSVDGSEVTLTLASPVPAGRTVSLDYTAPMSNPIQDASGNKAQSFTRWYLVTESTITITNPVITVPGAPTALSATAGGNTQINLSWTAPGENGGAPISGYKIESSPDGVANWTELVANTGNANTTYEHLGLTVGTIRHYRVSAINSEGAGDPSNIDDATAIIPTVTLRTQTVLESIGTAALLVTLNQPAGDPLSVPWSTLSVEAVPPSDYTARGGTLIIPPRTTNATISITIINDADEEPTETFLVLLSPGEGYVLGGSGATVSILDDDGDGPAPIRATVNGTTVVLTYNKPLDGASTPSSTAFHLRMAGDPVSINEVSVDGSEVTLTLASPVQAGQTVSLDYTQPVSDPIQDASGNKAQSFTRWYLVTDSTMTGTVDTTAPSVTISGVPATSDAPFTATFTFSEAVTGFAVGDITLGNATASSFTSTSTTVYRALVTPTAAGAVTVDVPANAAQDAAGNGNTAATRASSTYTGSATRGVTVSATVLSVTEGSTGTYTVVLDSQPTANVTVTPSRTGSTDVTFSPATLTFTALNWNTVQPVTVTAAQDSDAVDDNATISHAVTGGDYVGETVESVVVRVNDDESVDTVPGVPTDLSASTGGNTRINLSWTAPGDDGGSSITGYKIEVSPDGNANWTGLVANTGNTTTTYAHIGLAVGTTRHYRVSAINSVGAGDPSNIDDATTRPITGPITGVGGGGGGGGPSPSVVDFEWNVKRDIEELDGGNDRVTGVWSDGTTLWVADNADGAGDAVYAYDLATGERVESREFALAETNRAPRGFWSDGETVWVSDSGRERLFAYRLADGERLEEREFELPRENRDARGIWSDEKTMWVLDGRADALFAYDLESGALLAEYELDAANDDPRGIWSDRTTVWVSDHGAKRLFAYRLPAPEGPAAEDAEPQDLERVRDEEFPKTVLSRASNNSPRGLWSDGDVMYVADESDDRVYSYNMPDAIDARLASLTLSGVDIGEFDPGRTEYEAVVADGVTATTVEAEAMQRRTDVAIDPPDADEAAEGYQVALEDLGEITVTVTSADGSRTKTYRVRLGEEEAAGPVAGCLRGDIAVGFSLVVYAGGSIEDLVACAESRDVAALYVLDGGEWVSYILGAPELVNRSFAGLFAEGLAALTPLIARSDGPASPDPSGAAPRPGDATQPWPACLQGEIAEGFNLVVYEGGSVGELEACAEGVGLAALYALSDGVWVSYIVGAPEFVNRSFAALFADGVPSATPLVGKRDAP